MNAFFSIKLSLFAVFLLCPLILPASTQSPAFCRDLRSVFVQKSLTGSLELLYRQTNQLPPPDNVIRFSKKDTGLLRRAFTLYRPTQAWARRFGKKNVQIKKFFDLLDVHQSKIITLAFPSPVLPISLAVDVQRNYHVISENTIVDIKICIQSEAREVPSYVKNMLLSLFLPDSLFAKYVGSRLENNSIFILAAGGGAVCCLPLVNQNVRREAVRCKDDIAREGKKFLRHFFPVDDSIDLYAVLGFEKYNTNDYANITQRQIRKAYHRLSLQYAGDKWAGKNHEEFEKDRAFCRNFLIKFCSNMSPQALDELKGQKLGEEVFKIIQPAYETLFNDDTRAKYNNDKGIEAVS